MIRKNIAGSIIMLSMLMVISGYAIAQEQQAKIDKPITETMIFDIHGHPCDGLVTAACGLSLGLKELYPDGSIDRTDTCCITNNSPCYGDVAAYLTGGRIRFGTQKINPNMGNEFILYRISTKQAVKVSLKDGVFPKDVADLENQIRKGDFTVEQMRLCQKKEWDYARPQSA